jgi:hypothetical protein
VEDELALRVALAVVIRAASGDALEMTEAGALNSTTASKRG